MTADQRLDQLELLIAQNLAVSDRHTAQLKQLVGLAIQQSDNMQFALEKITKLEGLEERQQVLEEQIQVVMGNQQGMDSKLDRILDLLGGKS